MNADGRRCRVWWGVVLLAAVLGGCQAVPSKPDATAVESSETGSVLRLSPALAADLSDDRLVLDLRRGVRDLGWGLGRVMRPKEATDSWVFNANVLSARDVGLNIVAARQADGSLQLTAKAQPLADAALERAFLVEYQRKLTGPPAPLRHRGFALPDPPP
jgi:hypothetical protein